MSDAAIANLVTGVVTIVTLIIGFLTLWIKLRYGVEHKANEIEKKVEENTAVTKESQVQAIRSAKSAVVAATQAAERTDAIAQQLNGKLDEKIMAIVKLHLEPVYAMIKAHIEQDDKNMREIRQTITELRDLVKR